MADIENKAAFETAVDKVVSGFRIAMEAGISTSEVLVEAIDKLEARKDGR